MAPKKSKKQSVVKQIPCHHWGKYHVKNTTFTLESAHKLLTEFQSKKSHSPSKGKLIIYETGVKIKRSNRLFKDKILFANIVRFFVFKTEPHMLIMGVEHKKKRFYYALLFREVSDVNEICDLIECHKKSRQDSNEPQPEPTTTTTNYYEVSEKEKPVKYAESNEIGTSTNEEPYEKFQEEIVVCQEYQPELESQPVIYKKPVEIDYENTHTDDMGTTKIDALLLRTNNDMTNNNEWVTEDMRYLEYNPQLGTTTETEAGPIYMYTAHFSPTDYAVVGTCESDSDSSFSEDEERSSKYASESDHHGIITKKKDGQTVVMAHRGSDAGMYL